MKRFLTALLIFVSFSAQAKKNDPTTGDLLRIYDSLVAMGGESLEFSDVVEVDGKSQEDLYFLAKSFFAENFRSANDVIQLDDPKNATVAGRGGFSHGYTIAYMLGSYSTTIEYTFFLRIQCKDNRYKYDISSIGSNALFITTIYGECYTESNTPNPMILFPRTKYAEMKRYARVPSYHILFGVYSEIPQIIASLKSYMQSTNTPQGEDW